MDSRALSAFIAVVDAGSVTRAAQRLGLAQPALSQRILKLERELGVRLLERHARGVRPTEAGSRFAERGRLLLGQLARLGEEVAAEAGTPRGRVEVGLASSASAALTAPLLTHVRRHLPEVDVHVVETMSGFLDEWTRSGRLDMAVIYDARADADAEVRPLLRERLCLIGPPHAAAEGIAPLRLLSERSLILPAAPHGLRRLVDRACAAAGVVPRIALELDSTVEIKRLVARGEGFAVLSHCAAAEEVARGELSAIPLADPPLERSVDLLVHRPRAAALACRAVADALARLAVELSEAGSWRNTAAVG